MRSRNIKPGFFKNELLAELSHADRLLFIGLWCLADREGRLEDRPKRIKMELMPMDDYDVSTGLKALESLGFIARYVFDGQGIIEVSSFSKHQSPHGTEKDSELPDANGMFTVHERGKNGQVTGQKRLINVIERESTVTKRPDSLNPDSLNPDSLNPEVSLSEHSGSNCPHLKIVELYNTILADHGLPARINAKLWAGSSRQSALSARWKEDTDRQSLEWWERFFAYVSKSDFLMGRTAQPFTIDAGWLFKKDNFIKVMEGKYHG